MFWIISPCVLLHARWRSSTPPLPPPPFCSSSSRHAIPARLPAGQAGHCLPCGGPPLMAADPPRAASGILELCHTGFSVNLTSRRGVCGQLSTFLRRGRIFGGDRYTWGGGKNGQGAQGALFVLTVTSLALLCFALLCTGMQERGYVKWISSFFPSWSRLKWGSRYINI